MTNLLTLNRYLIALFILVAGVLLPVSAESLDTDELDSLFSSNIKLYVEKVEQLNRSKHALSKADLEVLHFYLGRAYLAKGDYEQAELSFKAVLQTEVDIALRYRATSSLVNLYQHSGNFYQAFSYAFQLTDTKFNGLSPDEAASGFLVMALALMDSGLYDEAKNTLLKIKDTELSARLRCSALYLTSQIAYKGRIFVKPLEQIKAENQQCAAQKQTLYALLTDSAVSLVYLNQGDVEQALQLLQEKNAQVVQLGYENLTVGWQAVLVNILASKKDLSLLETEARKLEPLTQTKAIENSLEVALLAYQGLAASYKLLGDQPKAMHYLELYQQTYQKANNRQMTAALAYYAALMQAAERKQEISQLNQQTRQLQLENELAKAESTNSRLYLLFAVTLLLLLVTILFRTHRSGIKLKERVTFDKLTKVFSRDHFEDVLATSLVGAQSQQQKLGFVLFDLDHFKQVNDSYGHQAGDWVLQQAANAAKQCLRKSDAIGRIGGEEFAILLQDCDLEMSRALAESVRLAIADIDTSATGHKFAVSASFGVSTAQDYGYSARKLFSVADEALYQAKQQGRNRVMPEEQL